MSDLFLNICIVISGFILIVLMVLIFKAIIIMLEAIKENNELNNN